MCWPERTSAIRVTQIPSTADCLSAEIRCFLYCRLPAFALSSKSPLQFTAASSSGSASGRNFGEPLAISGIVLWELAKLVQLKRLELDFEDAGFRAFLRTATG